MSSYRGPHTSDLGSPTVSERGDGVSPRSRTLLDVLTECHDRFCSQAYHEEDAQRFIDRMSPETRQALEVGLLLTEVERVSPRWSAMGRVEDCSVLAHDVRQGLVAATATAPTLHAALTALLAQLEEDET